MPCCPSQGMLLERQMLRDGGKGRNKRAARTGVN